MNDHPDSAYLLQPLSGLMHFAEGKSMTVKYDNPYGSGWVSEDYEVLDTEAELTEFRLFVQNLLNNKSIAGVSVFWDEIINDETVGFWIDLKRDGLTF